jgi:hypothetical protein
MITPVTIVIIVKSKTSLGSCTDQLCIGRESKAIRGNQGIGNLGM